MITILYSEEINKSIVIKPYLRRKTKLAKVTEVDYNKLISRAGLKVFH